MKYFDLSYLLFVHVLRFTNMEGLSASSLGLCLGRNENCLMSFNEDKQKWIEKE